MTNTKDFTFGNRFIKIKQDPIEVREKIEAGFYQTPEVWTEEQKEKLKKIDELINRKEY